MSLADHERNYNTEATLEKEVAPQMAVVTVVLAAAEVGAVAAAEVGAVADDLVQFVVPVVAIVVDC
jgi:hypothetical protein